MPTETSPAAKREILDALPRRALLELLDQFELGVEDRRKRAEILERLDKSRKANVPDVLDALSRDHLKEVCRHLGLDDGGRAKATLIGRILGTEPSQQGLGLDRERPTPEVRLDGTLTDEEAPVDDLQPPPPEKLTVEALERYLWSAADILRGSIDSSDYKSYIFGLLFLKRLSDVFEEEAEKLIAEGEPERIAWEEPDEHQFFVPPQARWSKLQNTATNIGEALNKACSAVEEANSWALEGVLAGVDFNDERRLGDGKNRDSVLSRLVQHFSKVSLRNAHLSEPDMLGRAYEYLIERFADDAGKKGGEFYTPNKVVELIVELLAPEPGMRISDPTCGSGGMLIQCAKYVQKHGGNIQNLVLHGQEKNLGTWGICKMNMLLHGIVDHRIEKGDTIRDPKLRDGGGLMLYDRVIANPPFSLDEWGIETVESDPYGRFRFGVPPKTKGDFAFVQHMVATLNLDGRLGVVLPHGALSRRTEEGIRRGLVEEDLVEAVVGLPARLFHGTPEPTAVLVLNRAKEEQRRNRVLFVDGSKGFAATSPRQTLRDEDIARLVSSVQGWREDQGFARVASVGEIAASRFDLTIAPYTTHTPTSDPSQLGLRPYFETVKGGIEELRQREAVLWGSLADSVSHEPGVEVFALGQLLKERKERRGDRELPVLSVTKSNGPMLAAERFGKSMHGKDLSRYLVCHRGDLAVDPMLLWDGAVGVQLAVDAGVVSPDYRVYELDRGRIEPRFFHELCRSRSMIEMFRSRARGTNQRRRRIPRADFERIRVQLPERPFQEAVARILGHLDALRSFASASASLPESVIPSPLPFEVNT